MTDDEHGAPTLGFAETLVSPPAAGDSLRAHPAHASLLAGRYEVLSLVGHGGMGNVYRVFDTELEEVVALKTLHDDLAHSELAVARFRAEVKLARRVTHPNVARTFDIGTSGDATFLTMEFIDGEPLDEVLQRGRMSSARAVEIAIGICSGLEAAHAAGVFHLDLKPANVLLEASGRVVISDFGIARAWDAAESHVPTFQGTPAYMAPEQVRGVAPFDGRTDMYAFGVMLFEMLAGVLPFVGPTPLATALARILEQVPPLPDDVPAELAAVVGRCLQVDREARFEDIREVLRALEQSLNGLDSAPTRAPAVERGELGTLVCVLPLHATGEGVPHLSTGLAAAIADELATAPGVRVRPVAATQQDDPIAAGRQLGVRVVVSGQMTRTEDHLDVRLEASSVADGFQLWSQRFSGSTRDLFTLASTAARAVAQAVTSAAPPARSALTDPVTIDLYMRARTLTRTHWHANTELARPMWERLLERVDDDPRVLAGAASYFSRLEHLRLLSAGFGHDVGTESFASRADDYANRAIAAAPQWPEPYCARAVIRFNQYDFAGSLADAREALKLAPGYAEAQTHAGRILLEVGPIDEAVSLLQQAHDIDPQQYNARWELVRGRALLRDWAAVDALLELPVTETDQRFMRLIHMARTDMWRSTPRYLDEPLTDLDRDPRLPFYVPTIHHVLRNGNLPPNVDELEQSILDFQTRYPRNAANASQHATEIAMRAGEPELALHHLGRCEEYGLLDLMWLENCPLLDGYREEPAYVRVHAVVSERADAIRNPRNDDAA